MRRTVIITLWVGAMAALAALGIYFVSTTVQEVHQGTFTYWEEEVIRFVGLAFLVVLVSKGMLAQLRRSADG